MLKRKKVSIVVPCYREEKHIKKTLLKTVSVLKKIPFDYEIICVIDGMVDDTLKIVKRFSFSEPNIKILAYMKNRGKGFAVRLGFGYATGDIIGFMDADGQIDPKNIKTLLNKIENSGNDIVIGSKSHAKSSVRYSLFRKLVSRLSHFYIAFLFGIRQGDTQAGIKFFKKQLAKKLSKALTIDRFSFDVEMLVASEKMGFNKIEEVPINVVSLNERFTFFDFIRFVKDIFASFSETLKIYYLYKVSNYYSNSNMWKITPAPKLIEI